MASWMIHLRIADQLMDRIPGLDETAFVMGNIAPDSGVPNADWTAYTPPKEVSHYKTRRDDETFFDIGRFLREHFAPEQIRSYSPREFSFFLGYYVHLLTDMDWTLHVYRPMIDLYVKPLGEDKNAFIWKMKRDWYDLDFRYLEEHPDFRAFSIYEHAAGFTNDFMEIFSRDAFDNRREYICGFYRGQHGELYREYPYLSPERADLFVAQTAESILNKLREALSMRKEKVTWEYSSGAVVYTRRHDQILFVLVQEMSGAYSFPKGHVEGNETEMDTARREIFEETGLRPVFKEGFREADEYDLSEKPGTRKRVTYFLAEFGNETLIPQMGEIRQISLMTYDQALHAFGHEGTKRILTAANRFLNSSGIA